MTYGSSTSGSGDWGASPGAGGGEDSVVEQAQEKAGEVAQQARQTAQEAREKASGKLRTQVDERSSQAGAQIHSTAQNLRNVGQELRNQGNEGPAKLADQVADRTERLGDYLQSSDADRILGDVEDFARRQPWAVMAGGLALGFIASRFLKASSINRYGDNTSTRSRSQLRASLGSSAPSSGSVSGYGDSGVD